MNDLLEKNYEIKMKILRSGNSSLLKEWQQHSTITEDQFAQAIAWICEDPRNYAALTATGWEKIRKIEYRNGMVCFRYLDGRLWGGSAFDMPLSEEEQEFYGDTHRMTIQKIAICSGNRI